MSERAYVGLGANLGDARTTLDAARDAIGALPGTRLAAASSWYRSAPLDASGPDFVNGVVAIDTTLEPLALLDALRSIERAHGRRRPFRNAPRTLDLDLLLYGTRVFASERLTLPHPRLHERAFVLAPLLEIAPSLAVPGLAGSLHDRLARLSSQRVERLG